MTFDPVAYINEPRWQESRLGLERIQALLDLLGRPQDRLRFVHVAGTNGKGSTCSYLSSVLQAAGYKTGLFTSPFIETFEERIRIDGANISLDDLTAVTLRVREQAEILFAKTGDHPTEFELMTAVALEHFASSECDIAVLEVGLGGRLDSTNVIEAPEVSVIASIALDHTHLLGNTLNEIAHEKAGIIKQGVPVVSWPHDKEALDEVLRIAAQHDAEVSVLDLSQLEVMGVECFDGKGILAHSSSLMRSFEYKGIRYTTQLLGTYQPQNAALAIEVVKVLRLRGWDISEKVLQTGIAAAQWPGRFEVLPQRAGHPIYIVDGGHNPQGARALASSLEDVFPEIKPVFVMGVLEDKNYHEMIEAVLPLASAFVAVTPDNPRALSSDKLAQNIADLSLNASTCVTVLEADTFREAFGKARRLAGPHGVVCAFGSLYSIAAIKAGML